MKRNLIICVSSHNNYDMLKGEVFNNINFEGFEFINIDDNSSASEVEKGKKICADHNVEFIENKSIGVQFAVDSVIDYLNEHRKECEWIFLFQHDNYPISKNFFNRLSKLIENGIPENVASLGFNHLDSGDYTAPDSYERWKNGEKVIGLLGKFHLSVVKSNTDRWASVNHNSVVRDFPDRFMKPFSIEIPLETAIGINIHNWKQNIKPTIDFQFHLWYPDIMMQYLSNNLHCLILPDLYCFNDQSLKEKYGFHKSSASGAKEGQEEIFGEYGPHLANFSKRWGWDYEKTKYMFTKNTVLKNILKLFNYSIIREKYEGTLIDEFGNYDLMTKQYPYKTFELDY